MRHPSLYAIALSAAVILAGCGSTGDCPTDLTSDFGGCPAGPVGDGGDGDGDGGGDTPDPVPAAVGDEAETDETVAVTFNVLDNDDPGTGPATVTSVTQPSNGTVSIDDASTGEITYTPTGDFSGIDTFSYTITDSNGNTSVATVAVVVADLNPINTTLQDIDVRATFNSISAAIAASPVDSAVFGRDADNTITIGPLAAPSIDLEFFTGSDFDAGIDIDTEFSYVGGFAGTDGDFNLFEINLDVNSIAHGSLATMLIPSAFPHAPFEEDDPDTDAIDESNCIEIDGCIHFARLALVVPGPDGSGLDYTSFGVWEIDGPNIFGSNFVGGVMSFGVLTSAGAMPTTGGATYDGIASGLYSPGGADGTRSYLNGTASLTADFAAGTVSADITDISAFAAFGETDTFGGVPGSDAELAGAGATEGTFTDVHSDATISGNSFSGPADTVATPGAFNGAMSGEMRGNFYGPAAEEVGGVIRLGDPGGENAILGFGAKD